MAATIPFFSSNSHSHSHNHKANLPSKFHSFPSKPTTTFLTIRGSHNASHSHSSSSSSSLSPPDPEVKPDLEVKSDPKLTPDRRRAVRVAWEKLVRWSRGWRSKSNTDVLQRTNKVVVLGGGSFGTAMAAHVANRKAQLEVVMLVRDPQVCSSINDRHRNCKYFPDHMLPDNVIATNDAKSALCDADYCFHAVPVQFTSAFLEGVADYVDPGLPFISLSKGTNAMLKG